MKCVYCIRICRFGCDITHNILLRKAKHVTSYLLSKRWMYDKKKVIEGLRITHHFFTAACEMRAPTGKHAPSLDLITQVEAKRNKSIDYENENFFWQHLQTLSQKLSNVARSTWSCGMKCVE